MKSFLTHKILVFDGLIECQLTANLSWGINEIAVGVIPSICSFTKADMAMSGRPAVKGTECYKER